MAEPSISKKRKRRKRRKRGNPNPTTGLIGVRKSGKKFVARTMFGGTDHFLGAFDTKEQAGIAYDRFYVDKSTEEVLFALNYPKMSDADREEALPPPKRKRPNPQT
jgi:hypothetical protein